MAKPTAPDLSALSFEDALRELDSIVRKLEAGDVSLEDSVAAYERGVALRRHCEARLKDAEMRVEAITVAADGTPSTVPLDNGGDR